MVFLAIKYIRKRKKNTNILKFEYILISLYGTLLLKEINVVLKMTKTIQFFRSLWSWMHTQNRFEQMTSNHLYIYKDTEEKNRIFRLVCFSNEIDMLK